MKKLRSIVAIAFALMLMLAGLMIPQPGSKAYAEDDDAKRMNVVFVIDDSGSMVKAEKSDPDGLRFEAMELFLAIAAESGNRMGAVKFSDKIQEFPLQDMDGKKAKEVFSKSVSAGKSEGGTDIGLAINTATKMLVNDRDRQLDSVIILLTDGNTSLSDKDQLNQSPILKQEAIDIARSYGIKVFSVCLNAGGGADVSEVQEISDATGGECVEVKKAADLEDVFKLFYGLIYNTEIFDTPVPPIGSDRKLEVPFNIPDLGVEEANIIISTMDPSVTQSLTNPQGNLVDIDNYLNQAKTFRVIKLPRPESGEWMLTVYGDPGTQVKISLVYNNDFDISINDATGGNHKLKTPLGVDVTVTNCGTAVSDAEIFKKNPIHLVVNNLTAGTSDDIEIPDGKTSYDLSFDTLGDYTVYAYIEIDGIRKETETISYSFVNSTPTAQNFDISKTVFPFTAEEVIDISKYARDAEDADLTFEIDDYDLERGTVDLQGSILTVDVAKCGSGTITLVASDSNGGSVTFKCEVSTTNALIFIIIGIVAVLLIIILIIVIIKAKHNKEVIDGTVKIVAFSHGQTSAPQTVDGGKGDMYLGRYFDVRIDTGISLAQCYLHAGPQSSYVFFYSKTGYFSDFNPSVRQKKIRLDDMNEVTIFSDEEGTSGIRITYQSSNNSYGGF